MVTIRQTGVRDAQELLLEAFQTGSFYGPLSWNKLFDARGSSRKKGIHYDETMLFGDDASVLHRVSLKVSTATAWATCSTITAPAPGRSRRQASRPAKIDDLRMYWEWLQYFVGRGARNTTTGPLCGTGRFLPVLVPIRRGR